MNTQVSWLLELEIQAGRADDFQKLVNEMVSATETNEPGTLDYQWSVSADGTRCHFFERYADSAAVLTHLGNFGDQFAGRFLELLKPLRFVVYGTPNAAVREALAGFNPTYMDPFGGFRR